MGANEGGQVSLLLLLLLGKRVVESHQQILIVTTGSMRGTIVGLSNRHGHA